MKQLDLKESIHTNFKNIISDRCSWYLIHTYVFTNLIKFYEEEFNDLKNFVYDKLIK